MLVKNILILHATHVHNAPLRATLLKFGHNVWCRNRSLHCVYLRQWLAVQLDYGPMHNSENWQTTSGCRQAKMFLHGPDKKLSRFALSIPRQELKILVGLLTGHITLNRHLIVIKIQEAPFCPACGEQKETSFHFLGECYTNMQIRYFIFGAHLMQPAEVHKVESSILLQFARATKSFRNL